MDMGVGVDEVVAFVGVTCLGVQAEKQESKARMTIKWLANNGLLITLLLFDTTSLGEAGDCVE